MTMLVDRVLNSRYYDVDLYEGSEDWMGMQVDYIVYDGKEYKTPRRFGVGNIWLTYHNQDLCDVDYWDEEVDEYKRVCTITIDVYREPEQVESYETFSGGYWDANFIVQLLDGIEKFFDERD